MKYDFLVESYETERIKVLSVRSEFTDDDLAVRSKRDDPRGRSVHEHTVHQCASEDAWFRTMLGVDVGRPSAAGRRNGASSSSSDMQKTASGGSRSFNGQRRDGGRRRRGF